MNITLAGVIVGFCCWSLSVDAAVVKSDSIQTSRLRVTNQCNKTLWIQQDYQHTTNDPIVVQVPQGLSYDYAIPDKGLASTRFWAKSGCNANGYDCTIGESTGVPSAQSSGQQHGPYAPDINSKFEASWGCLKAIFDNNPALCAENPSAPAQHLGPDTWWNGSTVDGYTFPYAIVVKNDNGSCVDLNTGAVLNQPGVNCGHLDATVCPTNANLSTEGKYNAINGVNVTNVNLQWMDSTTNTPVGCFSPCSKLTTAQGSDNGKTGGGWHTILGGLIPSSPEAQMYCCPTPPVSSGACSAGPAARSSYSQSVHQQQQCNAYTYAYDDAKGLARCGSQTQFEVVFCPKAADNNPPPVVASMTMVIPAGVQVMLDGKTLANNQTVTIANGGVLTQQSGATTSCTLAVDATAKVTALSGNFCSQLQINNVAKTVTVMTPVPSSVKMQFNLNTSVGITAYLNQTLLVNAQPIDVANYVGNATLMAMQNNKQGTCQLTITANSVVNGSGEMCTRLNIVKDGNGVINVYLPADIPNTGGVLPPATPHYVVFGMSASMYANFQNNIVTNGSKVALDSLGNASQINLIAYQSPNSANCVIAKSGNALSIVANSGLLCNAGMVLMAQANGDFYIGLPSPLPVAAGQTAFELGIAQGMSVSLGSQSVLWNASAKTVNLPQGSSTLTIVGNTKLTRQCTVTLVNKTLTWPAVPGCQGLVQNGNVLYFPAF